MPTEFAVFWGRFPTNLGSGGKTAAQVSPQTNEVRSMWPFFHPKPAARIASADPADGGRGGCGTAQTGLTDREPPGRSWEPGAQPVAFSPPDRAATGRCLPAMGRCGTAVWTYRHSPIAWCAPHACARRWSVESYRSAPTNPPPLGDAGRDAYRLWEFGIRRPPIGPQKKIGAFVPVVAVSPDGHRIASAG